MKARSLLWCLATVVIAAAVSFVAARIAVDGPGGRGKPAYSDSQTLHDWLHQNLRITAEQERRLHPIEEAFEADRARIRNEISSASRRLADAIRAHDLDSSEVRRAREELTRAQGELQESTLRHFFSMKEHLDPEQGEKLLKWTRQSLVHGNHE